jgi:hypothetical protein
MPGSGEAEARYGPAHAAEHGANPEAAAKLSVIENAGGAMSALPRQ